MCGQKYVDKSGTLIQWRSVPLLMFVSYCVVFTHPMAALYSASFQLWYFTVEGLCPQKIYRKNVWLLFLREH